MAAIGVRFLCESNERVAFEQQPNEEFEIEDKTPVRRKPPVAQDALTVANRGTHDEIAVQQGLDRTLALQTVAGGRGLKKSFNPVGKGETPISIRIDDDALAIKGDRGGIAQCGLAHQRDVIG